LLAISIPNLRVLVQSVRFNARCGLAGAPSRSSTVTLHDGVEMTDDLSSS
jgi:hypothetical protein